MAAGVRSASDEAWTCSRMACGSMRRLPSTTIVGSDAARGRQSPRSDSAAAQSTRIPDGPIPLRRDQTFGRMNSSGPILPSQKRPKRDSCARHSCRCCACFQGFNAALMQPSSSLKDPCEVPSEIFPLELLAREAKLGEPILEVTGEKRHRQEIRGGATIVCSCGLAAQFPPALRPGVASPQPRQGNEVNLLIFAHGADEALQLLKHRVLVRAVLQDFDHPIVTRIRGFIGNREDIFSVEFARLRNDEADFFGGNGKFGVDVGHCCCNLEVRRSCSLLAGTSICPDNAKREI